MIAVGLIAMDDNVSVAKKGKAADHIPDQARDHMADKAKENVGVCGPEQRRACEPPEEELPPRNGKIKSYPNPFFSLVGLL